MKPHFLILQIFVFFGLGAFAQEHENEPRHEVLVTYGYTFVPKGYHEHTTEAEGVFIPSLGFDYGHSLSSNWEIGMALDLEFGNYIIREKDLNRENAFIIIGFGAYKVLPKLKLVVGGGVELEKHEHLAVLRLGTQYSIKLKNNWLLGPGFFYDVKKGYDTWTLSIAIGKEF